MAAREETEFLPAALEILERPPSPAGRAIALAVIAFFSIAVLWAFIGEIDIVASAQGKIIPGNRVKLIQPLEKAVVRAIHVREGQRVRAGELLVELDPTESEADLARIDRELLAARLDQARLRRLEHLASGDVRGTVSLDLPVGLAARAGAVAAALQERRLQSQWSAHRAETAALSDTIASREAGLAAIGSEIERFEATLPLVSRRSEALKGLVEKKLASEQGWLELEEQRIGQRQELASLRSRRRQAGASVKEAHRQLDALVAGFRADVLAGLAETQRRIALLQQERRRSSSRSAHQRLNAPVAGLVQQLAVHTVGGVVTPAQELMRIVPDDGVLEVEAWLLNRDVGFVEPGQRAEVKVAAFPFTRYGTLDARVKDISGDAVTDRANGLVYVARVVLEQSAIRVGERLVQLVPGMAVTVEVKTGTRRLIEFILSPLLRYRDESLGER